MKRAQRQEARLPVLLSITCAQYHVCYSLELSIAYNLKSLWFVSLDFKRNTSVKEPLFHLIFKTTRYEKTTIPITYDKETKF